MKRYRLMHDSWRWIQEYFLVRDTLQEWTVTLLICMSTILTGSFFIDALQSLPEVSSIDMRVEMREFVEETDIQEFVQTLQDMKGVSQVTYISREDQKEELFTTFSSIRSVFDVVGESLPVPHAVMLSLSGKESPTEVFSLLRSEAMSGLVRQEVLQDESLLPAMKLYDQMTKTAHTYNQLWVLILLHIGVCIMTSVSIWYTYKLPRIQFLQNHDAEKRDMKHFMLSELFVLFVVLFIFCIVLMNWFSLQWMILFFVLHGCTQYFCYIKTVE